MDNHPAIEISSLHKTYKSFKSRVVALDGIDLTVAPGEVFGLLGPNGAGKTTAVKVLLDLTRATAGSAKLFGLPTSEAAARTRVGYLPEGHKFPGYLTARQTLSIFGRMSGMDSAAVTKRAMPLLEQLRIHQWADIKVRKFSKGMTQRLGIAAALLHDPALLLLDEPTDGVDPVGRREIRDILKEEARKGKTVFLNSHLLSEIELTCDRVAVLRKGKIAAIGRIDELTKSDSRYRFVAEPMTDSLVQSILALGGGIERQNGHLVLSVTDTAHLNAIVDRTRASGSALMELTPLRSTLEDVFVDLIRTEHADDNPDAGGLS